MEITAGEMQKLLTCTVYSKTTPIQASSAVEWATLPTTTIKQ
jgi:hypothetical protein